MSLFLSYFLQSSLSIAYVGGVEKSHKDLYGVRYYALQIELAGFVEKEKVKKKHTLYFHLCIASKVQEKKKQKFSVLSCK